MAGKVSGVTHPADLANGATITETWVDNVTNSIIGLDGALAKVEPIYALTTAWEVDTDNTEQTAFSYTVPANTLGTANLIRFQCATYYFNTTSTRNITYKLYYGTSSTSFTIEAAPDSANRVWYHQGSVQGNGATNAQILYHHGHGEDSASAVSQFGNIDTTVAEDSTTALDFKFTITMNTSSATFATGFIWAVVYLVDVS